MLPQRAIQHQRVSVTHYRDAQHRASATHQRDAQLRVSVAHQRDAQHRLSATQRDTQHRVSVTHYKAAQHRVSVTHYRGAQHRARVTPQGAYNTRSARFFTGMHKQCMRDSTEKYKHRIFCIPMNSAVLHIAAGPYQAEDTRNTNSSTDLYTYSKL